MDRIIDDKKRIEFNKKQEDELLKDINCQEEIFKEMEKNMVEELAYLEEIQKKSNSIKIEKEENNSFREKKKKNFNLLNEKIKKIKKLNDKEEKEKIIQYIKVDSDNDNVICNKCHYNCHTNCQCIFTSVHKFFCHFISFSGKCKICHCGVSFHERSKTKFEKRVEEIKKNNPLKEKLDKELKRLSEMVKKQKEEEDAIHNKNIELEKQKNEKNKLVEKLSENQKDRTEYLKRIENVIKSLKDEKDIVVKKINGCIKEINNIECEVLKILNQIKLDLDYLRKNSINKEYNKTMEEYLEERIKCTEDYSKRLSLENIKKLYTQLIFIENIDITQITCEKFMELKEKTENKSNLVYY